MIDFTREKPVAVAEVVEYFGVSRRTVEKWFRGGLESVKVGGRRYTTLEAVNRFSVPSSGQDFDNVCAASRKRYKVGRYGVADMTEAIKQLDARGCI